MNTILPKPYGLGGKVIWISVYEDPLNVTTIKESIIDAANHYNLDEEEIDRMNKSVIIQKFLSPVPFVRTIYKLVEMAKRGLMSDVSKIINKKFVTIIYN